MSLALAWLAGGCDCVPCPGGYACVLGRCQPSGIAPPADLATEATPDDLAIPPMSTDLSVTAGADLSTSLPPPDLAPACVPKGGSCYFHKDAVCCSRYCIYSSNTCR